MQSSQSSKPGGPRAADAVQQKVELKAAAVLHVGACDNSAGAYPLAKKKQTMEFLRDIMHLRARTNTIGAVARVRNALAAATHAFFQGRGFLYVHTPVVTASDCEGAGEMFQVPHAPRVWASMPSWLKTTTQLVMRHHH